MGKITYADEIDARFGVPWTDDFKYVKGQLECALSDEEIDRLTVQDPVRAETLTRLLLDQPNSEKEDPIEWGWTLPGWRRVCLLYTSPSPRDGLLSRMPSSA